MTSVGINKEGILNQSLYRRLTIFVFTIFCIGLVFYFNNATLGDYANYYYGTRFLIHGIDILDIYDPATFNDLIIREGVKGVFADYAPVPPCTLLFYFPFVFFDIYVSKMVFVIFSLILFSISFYRIVLFNNIKWVDTIIILLIMIVPIYSNILLGQSYLLVFAFLMEGYIFSAKGNKIKSSLMFSIPIALKIFPAIILIWLFFSDRRKVFFLTIGFVVILFLSMVPFMEFDFLAHYTTYILPRLMNGEINDPFSITYQSLDVVLKRIFVYEGNLNPNPIISSYGLYSFFKIVIVAFFLSVGIQIINQYKHSSFLTFGLILLIGFLISGYGTNYSLLLLIPLGVGIAARREIFSRKTILYGALFIISFFPVHKVASLPMALQFSRLVAMVTLFFMIYSVFKIKPHYREYIVIVLIMFIFSLYNYVFPKDKSDYYLKEEPSLLITNYKVINGGLILHYIGRYGSDSLFYKTKDSIIPSSELVLMNNQVFYKGKQITQGKDIKKSPLMLLNMNEVLYLSDMGRGVGLTGLRKVKF